MGLFLNMLEGMKTTPLIVSRIGRPGLLIALMLLVAAPLRAAEPLEAKTIDLRSLPALAEIVPILGQQRVVFVGETHDELSHHLVQLAIISALHRQHEIAIGVEFIQQPFQAPLDAYIAGEIDEETMLLRTQYMDRWGFDYRLYRPILQFARDNRIPLIALNVPSELTEKVVARGLDGLTPEDRAALPEIDRSDLEYREQLSAVFQSHPSSGGITVESFIDAQLLWDEGMAERTADYLRQNPKRIMVVLAGAGHLA